MVHTHWISHSFTLFMFVLCLSSRNSLASRVDTVIGRKYKCQFANVSASFALPFFYLPTNIGRYIMVTSTRQADDKIFWQNLYSLCSRWGENQWSSGLQVSYTWGLLLFIAALIRARANVRVLRNLDNTHYFLHAANLLCNIRAR